METLYGEDRPSIKNGLPNTSEKLKVILGEGSEGHRHYGAVCPSLLFHSERDVQKLNWKGHFGF